MIKKNGVWILLLLTLAACLYVAQQEAADQTDGIAVVTRAGSERASKHQIQQAQNNLPTQDSQKSAQLLRPQLTDQPVNIFSAFVPPSQSNQGNTETPAETAPPNPFTFAGKLVDDGKIIVFLMDAQKNYSVVSGDIVADVWQVRSIVPPMMTIRYLPLKIDMQLQIGALS